MTVQITSMTYSQAGNIGERVKLETGRQTETHGERGYREEMRKRYDGLFENHV